MKQYIIIILLLTAGITHADPFYEVFTLDGKQGLKNDMGQIVIPPEFDALGWSFSPREVKNNRIGFLKDGKWGVVSVDNRILYPALLQAVYDATSSIIVAGEKQVNGRFKRGVIDYEGELLVPYRYSDIRAHDTKLIVFDGDSFGMLDYNGKIIIPLEYKNIRQVENLRLLVMNKNGKCALFNSRGVALTDFIFDDIDFINSRYALAKKGIYKGLINSEGEWFISPKYKEINISGNKATAAPFWKYSFYSGSEEEVWCLDSIYIHSDYLFQHYASGSTWLTNRSGEVIFPQAKRIIKHGENLVVTTDEGTGLYDLKEKKWVFKPYFQEAVYCGDALLTKKREANEWELFSISTGKRTESRIQDFRSTTEGVYIKKNNAWGFISPEGLITLPPVYQEIKQYKHGLFHVVFHNAEGLVDRNANWKLAPRDQEIIDYNQDVFITRHQGLYNLYSMQGKRLYFSPSTLHLLTDQVIEQGEAGNIVRINFQGISIKADLSTAHTEEVFASSEGLIGVLRNGQYGFIDNEGRLRIANRYEDIQPFKNDIASVRLLGKWGAINKLEQLIIQPQYDSLGFFINGNAVASKDGKMGLVNRRGDVILPFVYDNIQLYAEDNYYMLARKEQKGIADKTGRVLIWPKYDEISLSNGYFVVVSDNRYGLHNLSGVSIVPPSYEKIIPVPGGKDFIVGKREKIVTLTLD